MKLYPLLLLPTFLLSCGQNNTLQSETTEAPRQRDTIKRLGIENPYNWNELKQTLSASIKPPWSDSYWPLYTKGLANRWLASDPKIDKGFKDNFTPFTQLQQLQEALDTKSENLNILSPGEKFDLLTNDFSLPNKEIMDKLESSHNHFIESDYFKYVQELEILTEEKDALQVQEQHLYYIFKDESQKKYKLQGEVRKLKKQIEETEDAEELNKLKVILANTEEKLKKQSELSKATFKTWTQYSETYYELEDRCEELKKEVSTEHIRPFAKELYDSLNFIPRKWPTFLSGWKSWAYYTHRTAVGEDWRWMGHCHGWAPAALAEPEPQHSVLVKKNDREILFTEGDIRGLLTKVWADELPYVRSAGYRCEARNVEKDENGRVVDGKICNKSCSNKDSHFDLISQRGRYLTVKLRQTNETKVILAKKDLDYDSQYLGTAYYNISEANQGINGSEIRYKLTINCRDNNPSTLHQALYHFIHKEKKGFVLDRTQTSEVWSHPVFKYESKGMPIPLKNGELSKPLTPVSVDKINDIYKHHRASGTEYLVQLSSTVYYTTENGPLPSYFPEEDNHIAFKSYIYTLELDKNQNVIGGEWGPIPVPNSDSHEKWAALPDTSPDFMWALPKDARPLGGQYDYDLLKRILDCSISTNNELKTMKLHPKLKAEVKYTECVL